MIEEIRIRPIGVIHSPYTDSKDIPIQGRFKEGIEAYAELNEEYEEGLTDLDQFSHAILIYHFNRSQKESIKAKPFLEPNEHGIFAIRSPYRPNHIGLSIVKIKKVTKNKLYFTEVDIFDQTPLIDIKPYVKYFDHRENVRSGWIDKHFENERIPKQTILRNTMKIAIPTNDRITIAKKTGRCKEFAIVEVIDGSLYYNYIPNQHDHDHNESEEHEHSHSEIIEILDGVDLLIVKNIGKYMKDDLDNFNIKYIKSSETDIIKAIDDYQKGDSNENSNS